MTVNPKFLDEIVMTATLMDKITRFRADMTVNPKFLDEIVMAATLMIKLPDLRLT